MKWLARITACLFGVCAASAIAAPELGKPAPAFMLKSQEGRDVSLSDFKGKWVLLYFYPKDFTPGCSIEAKNFQADLPKYKEKNAVILGVSVDSVETHKSFCSKQGLEFTLLADTDKSVSNAYDSFSGLAGMGFASRKSFLIDPQGMLRKIYRGVKPATHSAEVLQDLEVLQTP